MSNVIPFPRAVIVEIDGGVVRSSTITDANGTRSIPDDIGKFRYFVDVIETDGGRISMWDGTDHAEAIKQANLLALDFGGKVRDRTGDAA